MMETAKFQDFNFKLAVIQKLMYDQDVLSPRFDVYDFARNYEGRQINIDKEGYDIIPEVKQYFEQLEIPVSALPNIEKLFQDGGCDIYLQLCPFWHGEDDLFNIRSAQDSELLPNLKSVILFYDDDAQILDEFEQRGITAAWL